MSDAAMNYQRLVHPTETVTGTLTTDEQSARRLADCFAETFSTGELAVSLVDTGAGQWRLTVYFRPAIDEAAVRNLAMSVTGAAGKTLRFAHIAAKDWIAESLAGLKPVAAGRFVIHGAHDRRRTRGRIAIEIEAAQAFGTGHHGSTRGCLLALDAICKATKAKRPRFTPSPCKGEGRGGGQRSRYAKATPTRLALARRPPPFRGRKSFPRILDLGTGSGVLAIAAAKSLRRRVVASDIDPRAVRIAGDNARLNSSAALVRVCRGNGLTAATIRSGAPFDLVFANILLAPLQRLAAALTGIVAPRGRLVLSGLLNTQANAARTAYPHFSLERQIAVDGWTTLVLKRASTLPVQGGKPMASTPRGLHLPIHCR
jgi:ribosomal protein L11 methyltransferase